MIYTPRSQTIEAAPVELAGQRLMAVAVDGKAHLVDAGVFETLFHQEETAQKIEHLECAVASETRRPKPTPPTKRATPATAGHPAERKLSDVAQTCIRALELRGPLTSAELRSHVYHGLEQRQQLQNFSALSIAMQRKKLIERRTDPHTQLDKWHLCEGVGA